MLLEILMIKLISLFKIIDICQNKNLIFKEFKSYELKNCS